MSDLTEKARNVTYECDLDASPEKVWRALTVQAFRERWFPDADLVEADPVAMQEGEEIAFAMREQEPPFLESTVTFRIDANRDGGTTLRIVHALTDVRLQEPPVAVNCNTPRLQRAA